MRTYKENFYHASEKISKKRTNSENTKLKGIQDLEKDRRTLRKASVPAGEVDTGTLIYVTTRWLHKGVYCF